MSHEPELQMLWEMADPAVVLRERFGLADASAVVAWVGRVLADGYGIRVEVVERVVISSGNALAWVASADGRLIVKWCIAPERFPRLAYLADLTAWLEEGSIPVSAPIAALDGRRQVEVDGVSLGVQRVIEADLLHVTDERAVREAGATLARLHVRLAEYPVVAPDGAVPVESVAEQIGGWLASPPPHVPADAITTLRRVFEAAPAMPVKSQLVHGDYRSANILTRGSHVVAVLDFEEARHDAPVAELARSAVLLGTRFHDWGPVLAEVHEWLRQGYESVRPLTGAELAWWDVIRLWFTLVFVPAHDDPTGWGTAATELAQALS